MDPKTHHNAFNLFSSKGANNNLIQPMYVKGSKKVSIHSSPIHRDKYNSLFSITDQLHGAYSCSYETFIFSTLNWPKALCVRRFSHISNKLILTCFLYYKLVRNTQDLKDMSSVLACRVVRGIHTFEKMLHEKS
jgi:pyoverdine/dityrosine biosynthesis protein Dit1